MSPKNRVLYQLCQDGPSPLEAAQGQPIVVTSTNFTPGSVVQRGPHWDWSDQDGGVDNKGILLEMCGDGWCSVFWCQNEQIQQYRMGHDGKFDLSLCRLPDIDQPVPLSLSYARPGLPVVPGMHWSHTSPTSSTNMYGYIISANKNGFVVMWIPTMTISHVPVTKKRPLPLSFFLNGIPASIPPVSGMQVPSGCFQMLVTPENVRKQLTVSKSIFWKADADQEIIINEGTIISYDLEKMTCIVQFPLQPVVECSIGASGLYELSFAFPEQIHTNCVGRLGTPERLCVGTYVTRGPDYRRFSSIDHGSEIGRCGIIKAMTQSGDYSYVVWDDGQTNWCRSSYHANDLLLAGIGTTKLRSLQPQDLVLGKAVCVGPAFKMGGINTEGSGLIQGLSLNYPPSISVLWHSSITTTHDVSLVSNGEIFVVEQLLDGMVTPHEIVDRIASHLARAGNPQNTHTYSQESVMAIGSNMKYYDEFAHSSQFMPFCQKIREVGVCSIGRVWDGYCMGKSVVFKVVDKTKVQSSPTFANSLIHEANELGSLKHPHIARFLGVLDTPADASIIYERSGKGSLRDVLWSGEQLRREVCVKIVQGAFSGLKYLHSFGIVHGNLSPNNILVDGSFTPKLIDFGFKRSRAFLGKHVFRTQHVLYKAPELFVETVHDAKVDAYSMGIIMWELDTRLTPYNHLSHNSIDALIEEIVRSDTRPSVEVECAIDPRFRDLYVCCWSRDSRKRPTSTEALESLAKI
eukprot:TRINITY_DN3733_c0_g1_i14.p1 TRINITY_DN3733_c0_g1~~TRINITY_DN3733_c0_g1_i14.p1  ORF type:complete len:744 (-),score=98.26 TRINITY_DN3733_c0_g1_i14:262-2493(-)